MLKAKVGCTYLGNLFIKDVRQPTTERWAARSAYLKNWLHRYIWLVIGFPILVVLGILKDIFFPKTVVNAKDQKRSHRFKKFLDILLYVILGALGLVMLILLFAYFFL
ncbi:hypothetical protein [Mucilaginibacter aquaedulcis]|uniref:hypothetical protein n=1 Tax=Mucilaginibacter aquaedulcis TaxID=1187081 RepID=UPI0025B3D931|nr:hypothetical protein [Mucilaginibacter aquaedulcis]MDN3549215.1 hypothetical protein [Mucilaginibacter aquaedulcis]